MRRGGSSDCNSGAKGTHVLTIRCSGRSTPTISAPTELLPADFSNLRENGLIRITFTLPPNMKLIDPATNAPSTETTVDVWRMVPSVINVKLTGPDGLNPWPRGPEPLRAGISSMDDFITLQEQALGALLNARTDSESAAAAIAGRSDLVSARAVHE